MIIYHANSDHASLQQQKRNSRCSKLVTVVAMLAGFSVLVLGTYYCIDQYKSGKPDSSGAQPLEFLVETHDGALGSQTTDPVSKSQDLPDTVIQTLNETTLGLVPDWTLASSNFYIKHDISNMYVVPKDGVLKLTKYRTSDALFRYIPVDDYPAWGLLQHVNSKKYVTRKTTETDAIPALQDKYSYFSMFTVFQQARIIRSIEGLDFRPKFDTVTPSEGTAIVLLSGTGKSSIFAARNDTEQLVEVHGEKIIGGYWNLLIQRLNPRISYTQSVEVKFGFKKTEQISEDKTLAAEIGFSFMGASSKLSYNTKFGFAEKQTWTSETTVTKSWTIVPGFSVCIYQFVFEGQYDTIKMPLGSNIYADTRCDSEPPNLIAFD